MNSGKMIKEKREEQKLSIANLSILSGISADRIEKYENNEMEPTNITLQLLFDVLDGNYSNICTRIGKNIRRRRTNIGISQKNLVELLAKHKDTSPASNLSIISSIENGKNNNIVFIKCVDDLLKSIENKNSNLKKFSNSIFKDINDKAIYDIKELYPYKLTMDIDLGELLKEARLEQGYTYTKLSKLSGVSTGQIYSYEHGKFYPSSVNFLKLNKYLNLNINLDDYLTSKRNNSIQSKYSFIINNIIEFRRRSLNIPKYELYDNYYLFIFSNFSVARIYIIDKYLSKIEISRGLKDNSIFNIH